MLAIGLAFAATARIAFDRAYGALAQLGVDSLAAAPLEPAALVEASGWLAFERALMVLVAAWACGLLVTGARAGASFVGVARLRARAQALDPGLALEAVAARIAGRLGVAARVEIAGSEDVEVPVVVGWLRPLILLPLAMISQLDPVTLEAALAHELAHVRRCDYLLNAISGVIEAAMFHHPAVWWLARVASREREHACDDLVVARVTSPSVYARSLFALELLRRDAALASSGQPKPTLSMAADGSPLLDRIQRMTHQHHTSADCSPSTAAARKTLAPLPAWTPLVLTGLGLALALVVPACLDHDDPGAAELSAELEPAEGTIEVSSTDDSVAPGVGLRWLPDSVAAHVPQIEAAARRHGVDPDLLAVVVLVESGGNPRAESSTGARGLMQIMPRTADEIARQRALEDHALERLWDPSYNLDLGAWYLARLLERWGEVELAAAAYNGGTGAVERWTAGEGELPAETEAYKARVVELWMARDQASAPRD